MQKNKNIECIEKMHAVDILEEFRNNNISEYEILNMLPNNLIIEILEEATNLEKTKILDNTEEKAKIKLLEQISSDELTDFIRSLDEEQAKDILDKLDKDYAKELKMLLEYQEDSAGGIMAKEYISVCEDMKVGEVFEHLQTVAPDAETAYYIYITTKDNKLKGVVSLRELVIQSFDKKIIDISNTNVISVKYDINQKDVGNIFRKYGFFTIPVIDDDGYLIGIITADDMIDILTEENTKDIHRLGGIDEDEKIDGNIIDAMNSRLPWLFINLITAILASYTVAIFEDTINKVVALAVFMPIVAGMGGNAGTQTLTMIVRAIAIGELPKDKMKKAFLKEIITGLLMGGILGILITIIGGLWTNNYIFGIVLGVSMLINIVIANVSGFIIPNILKKVGIDPALASAVFVTTVTDILGFAAFLGIATMLINYLV